ncbi:hypothetical protein O6H91_21G057300 [Diphasiastrum complanatum]|uniref:Uncharacterized protein n=1 Tax=Diphasiastrum complanatum TaxID=34168 RepID=A0ACC2AKT3_DIPCM|nr:hypothetical protein O6H91_21G057300 [Diphasiastrum complanatum]
MKLSNQLTGIVNLVTLVLSIPIIGAGIWLASKHSTDCVKFLQWPVIFIGIFILLVSIAGFVGSCFRVAWLLWIYLLIMFLLIVLLFCFTVFAFVVTNNGAAHALAGKGYKEYRLSDFSSWLQKRVENKDNWRKIQSCLSDAQICSSLSEYKSQASFDKATLSPAQSGCCKPPSVCGYVFQNATMWISPLNLDIDTDCRTWNNNQSQLCFSCNSCRAGVLYNIKHDWRKVAAVNITVFIFLIVIYAVSCAAFRNARQEDHHNGYRKHRFEQGY